MTTPEVEFATLRHYLSRWNRRRRLRDALIWLPRGLLGGLLLAVVIAASARFWPLLTNRELAMVAAGLALVGSLAAAAVLLLWRPSLLQQARWADTLFALHERTSTAVEVAEGQLIVPASLARKQLADTLQAAGKVDAAARLPLQPVRQDLLVTLVALILLVAAVLLPNPQAQLLAEQRALDDEVAAQQVVLEALSEEIAANPALGEEQKERLQGPVEGALQQLREEDLSRAEAVAVLSEAEAELRALGADSGVEGLSERLAAAGEQLAASGAARSVGESLQSGNLAAAAAAAADLADELDAFDAQEQAALAEELADAAEALESVDGALSQQMAQAAHALREGDVAAAQAALQETAGTLAQRSEEQAAGAQAATAAAQVEQGRQAIARAGTGQPPGAEAGQQASGQQGAGQQGAGQQAAGGEGADGAAGEAGAGTGQADGAPAGGIGGTGGERGQSASVYVPDFSGLEGAGEDVQLPAECLADPEHCGALLNETPTEFGEERSIVPYSEVYGDYRDAAYRALDEGRIPLGLRGTVRDYFSSLEP